MANYSNLKAAIAAAIKTNGNQEITGQVLQDVLNSMVSVIGANYTFAGVATPATNPGTPDQNVMYLAMEGGTYTNFNGTVLPAGISLLMWNGTWTSETVMYGDGGVFDISVYKSSGGTLATFANLAAALDGGNNIPASARKDGMSVKFVQSSDNKYVQYRYMESDATTVATFTNTANWQGVDDEPTVGSKNLVESNGVLCGIEKVQSNLDVINDEINNNIISFGSRYYTGSASVGLSDTIPAGTQISFTVDSVGNDTVYLGSIQFRKVQSSGNTDTVISNTTFVCGKRYSITLEDSAQYLAVISPSSPVTVNVFKVEVLSENRIQQNSNSINNLKSVNNITSGLVNKASSIKFTLVGNIIDGISGSQENWRHTDFIKINDFGHIVLGTVYGSATAGIFLYSSNNESSYIGKFDISYLETERANFVNYKGYVSSRTVVSTAKYFRAVSYKDNTYADGLELGVFELLQNIPIVYNQESSNTLEVRDANNEKLFALDSEGNAVKRYINVLDYGIVEGEITDYSTIYKNSTIINELMEDNTINGAVLFFPKGIYCVATNIIKMQSNVDIVGASMSGTIFKVDSQYSHGLGPLFGYYSKSASSPLENVSYKDFTIDMENYILGESTLWNVNQKAIFCQYITNSQFQRIKVIGSPATAIGIDYLKNCVIDSCVLENCGKYWAKKDVVKEGLGGCAGIGIGTGGYDDENLIVTNNICIGCGHFGIFIENQGKAFGGSETKDARGIIIANNVCRGGKNAGIGCRGAVNTSIHDNICYKNKGAGIFVDLEQKNVVISNNQCYNNGIASDSELDYYVTPNCGGIYCTSIGACNNLSITNNDCKDNIGYGIHIEDTAIIATNLSIDNNKIVDNSLGELLIKIGSLYSSVMGNYIKGNLEIVGPHTSLAFKGNALFGTVTSSEATFNGNNNNNELV